MMKRILMKPVNAVRWQFRKVELFYAVAIVAFIDLAESVRVIMDLLHCVRR